MAILWCRDCREPLGLSNFRTNNTRGTGKEAYCKSCSNRRRQRRKRQAVIRRVFAELGLTYCRYCRKGKRESDFTRAPGLKPPQCDACLQRMLPQSHQVQS